MHVFHRGYLTVCFAGNEGSRYSARNETAIVNYDFECKRDSKGERAKRKERDRGKEGERCRVSMKGKLGPLLRNSNRVVRTILSGRGRGGEYYVR